MAEDILNSNYFVAASMNPTNVNFQILLNEGSLADGTYYPDSSPGNAFVSFDIGGVDGWDYNITGLTAGTTYATELLREMTRDEVSHTPPMVSVLAMYPQLRLCHCARASSRTARPCLCHAASLLNQQVL